jgi:hypothetical protein
MKVCSAIMFSKLQKIATIEPYLTFRVITYCEHCTVYSAFFLTVAIGNCMVKLIPPVNFCSDENIQTIFGTKLKDFLNYRIDYNSIS